MEMHTKTLITNATKENCIEGFLKCYYKLFFYYNENMIDKQAINSFLCLLNKHKEEIEEIKKMIDMMRTIYSISNKDKSKGVSYRQKCIDSYLNTYDTTIFCVNPFYACNKIQFANDVHVVNSANFPLQYKFIQTSNLQPIRYVKILYKYGDDLTSDAFILKQAKLIAKKLGLQIYKYSVIPLSKKDGIIEIVDVQINAFEDLNILKMIVHKNNITYNKFVTSFTFWLLISYIFGIGDRTEKNMLITTDADIIYIDFSYILGEDPKPMGDGFVIPHLIGKLLRSDKRLQDECLKALKSNFVTIRNSLTMITENTKKILTDPMFRQSKQTVIKFVNSRLLLTLNKQECECILESMFLSAVYTYKNIIVSLSNRIGTFLRQ